MPRDLHNMSRRYPVVVQLLDHSLPGTVVGKVFCIQTSFFSHGFHALTEFNLLEPIGTALNQGFEELATLV